MPTNGNVHRENNDDLLELISFFRQIQMDISLFSGEKTGLFVWIQCRTGLMKIRIFDLLIVRFPYIPYGPWSS